MKSLRLALIQLAVTRDKAANVAKAIMRIGSAAAQGAKMVVLPEFFNAPYGREGVEEEGYAEDLKTANNSPTIEALSMAAKTHGVWIVGGSMPEMVVSAIHHQRQYYNTCPIIDPNGTLVHAYRKMHLFDVSIPEKGVCFEESSFLTAGTTPCPPIAINGGDAVGGVRDGDGDSGVRDGDGDSGVRDSDSGDGMGCKFAVAICYDLRFPRLFEQITRGDEEVALMVVPAAFTATTGHMHWHLLMRARALDNQIFVAACSPARSEAGGGYQAYGHSLVVDPMANILAEAGEGEEMVLVDLNLDAVTEARRAIPIRKQGRI